MIKQNQVVFYTIKGSTIKKFIILDCLAGTGIFYTLKIITSSYIVGFLGCHVCVAGIKQVHKWIVR